MDSRVLLVRRAQDPWKGLWDVPGGFCDCGEHPADTATRELFEETGLRIRVTGFLGMWLDQYQSRSDETKRTLNIYYHAVPVELTPWNLESTEIIEARFFPASQLPKELAFPGHVPEALNAWRKAAATGELVTSLFDWKPQ
jgi:8-oxo-dGTP diphosphatase